MVTVVESILVTLEEGLFVGLGIDHGWAIILETSDAARSDSSVSRANLVVNTDEVALDATLTGSGVNLGQRLVALADGLSHLGDHLVEPGGLGGWNMLLGGKDVVRGGHLSHLVLNDCEHLTSGVEDSASELVLVVNQEPLCEDLSDFWSEDL